MHEHYTLYARIHLLPALMHVYSQQPVLSSSGVPWTRVCEPTLQRVAVPMDRQPGLNQSPQKRLGDPQDLHRSPSSPTSYHPATGYARRGGIKRLPEVNPGVRSAPNPSRLTPPLEPRVIA